MPLLEVFQFDPDQPHPSTKPPKPTSPPGPVLFQDNDLQTPELCPAIIIRKKRATECKTTTFQDDFEDDSPLGGRGKNCIFPFTAYTDQEKKNKKTFYGCTTELCGDAAGCNGFWCSTKVDKNGMHVQGQGNWGYCNSKCPKNEPISIRPPPSDTSIENFEKLSYEDKQILSTCHTTGGPQKKKPCVFPFKYKGKTYDSCNEQVSVPGQALSALPLVKGWCATEVDDDDNFIKDKWGYCEYHSCPFEGEDKECKTYSGPNNDNKCVFPFTFNGKLHYNCITTDDRCGVPWCPTEKHENAVDLESGSWGYCNHYCPDDGEA